MTYKVSLSSSNSFSVKQKSSGNFKVSAILGTGASDVANLADLDDVSVAGVQNGYVLTYNSATQKFEAVDPDNILSNAVTGGLPADFVNKLDTDLDDKIDLDAGGF